MNFYRGVWSKKIQRKKGFLEIVVLNRWSWEAAMNNWWRLQYNKPSRGEKKKETTVSQPGLGDFMI